MEHIPICVFSRNSLSHVRDSKGKPALPHGMYEMGPLYVGTISDGPELSAILIKTQ